MSNKIPHAIEAFMHVMVPNIQHGLDEVFDEDPSDEVLQASVLAFIDSVPEDDFEVPILFIEHLVRHLESIGATGQALKLQAQTVSVVAILCVLKEDG